MFSILPAFCLLGITLSFLIMGPGVWAADPLEELNQRFQQRKQASDEAVQDVAQQYHAKRAAMEAQWRKREQEIEARWQQMKREVQKKWNEARQSNSKDWVDYSNTYEARSTVDFEKGVIEITVLVPLGRAGSSQIDTDAIITAMQDTQEAFAATGSWQTAGTSIADPGSILIARAALPAAWTKILNQFEQIFSKESKSGKPVLRNQVATKGGAPVNRQSAKAFVESEVLPKAVVEDKPIRAQDGVARAQVTAKIPLIPEHIKERAQQYQEDVAVQAKRHGLDRRLLFAVIHNESYFNPLAQTAEPAYGLMLLVPRGAARDAYNYLYKDDIVLDDAYLQDPANNVELGAAYLHLLGRQLVPHMDEGEKKNYLVACAYSWGPGNIRDKIMKQARVQDLTSTQLFTLLTQRTPENTQIYMKRFKDRIAMYEELVRSQPEPSAAPAPPIPPPAIPPTVPPTAN